MILPFWVSSASAICRETLTRNLHHYVRSPAGAAAHRRNWADTGAPSRHATLTLMAYVDR